MGMALFFARPAQVHVAAGLRPAFKSPVHALPRRVATFDALVRCYPPGPCSGHGSGF